MTALSLPAIATMSSEEIDSAVSALEPHELEPARVALNDYISSLGIDNEELSISYLSAFSRVVARCRAKSSGPPKVDKPAKAPKPDKSISLDAALDF